MMIIVLNGYPGVGKLTIGRELASALNGRLLDIHTIYNLAFALTEFQTPAFWNTIEQVEKIAYDLVLKRPANEPIILTTVLTTHTDREREEWRRIAALGHARPPFCVVHIGCDLDENIRRITSAQRDAKRKPRDPEMAKRNQKNAKPLAGVDAKNLLQLDTTQMTPVDAARAIATWCQTLAS
jgi:tRNA uridine 5-carbamoylmethylation protein Kti12